LRRLRLGDALRDGAPGAARATILTIAGSWQWKAWDQFLHALRTGQSGVEAAFGKDLFISLWRAGSQRLFQ
jgi:hypothetical protein